MGEITFIVFAFLIYMLIMNITTGKIPKTGREGISSGKEISAVIVNENKTADKCATMKLKGEDGKMYKVKMSPTEAHLWIKGDTVKILVSEENSEKYRVLFHDYFRRNEDRLRIKAKEILEKKIPLNLFAARFVKYTPECLEAFKKSRLESQRIFAFVSFMKMIDTYTIITAILAIVSYIFVRANGGGFKSWIIPGIMIGVMVLFLNSAVKTCVKIKDEAEKSL